MASIVVRKEEGIIVAVSGAQRLNIQIDNTGYCNALLVSGREIVVIKNAEGQLVEKSE